MIKLEDIEKRLAIKKAGGESNPDGTQPKENQQNVPDAKSSKTRSPWIDAGIGAAGGGLLGSALGYLYGHKGRWLAYDALAGGIAGGGLGYTIGSSSNKAIEQNKAKDKSKYSVAGSANAVKQKKLDDKAQWEADAAEYKQVNNEGGFETNPDKVGLFKAFMNYRRRNYHEKLKHSNAKNYDEAKKLQDEDERNRVISLMTF